MSVSGDTLLIAIILLAIGLTLVSLKVKLILFRLGASMAWLCLGVLLLTGNLSGLSIGESWCQVLGFIFLVMTIAPLTLQMMTDVHHERKVRDQFGRTHIESSTEWKRNRKSGPTSSEDRQAIYRMQVRERLNRGRARAEQTPVRRTRRG